MTKDGHIFCLFGPLIIIIILVWVEDLKLPDLQIQFEKQ